MPDKDPALALALAEREIQALKSELGTVSGKLDNLIKERDKALVWGVLVLGSAVVGMATWIFNLITKAH